MRRSYFISKILENTDFTDNHWLWTGYISEGYGKLWDPARREMRYVHILSHLFFIGDIPEGFQVDHDCRIRHCFRPECLEAVTQGENIRRQFEAKFGHRVIDGVKTCKKGHQLTGFNAIPKTRGKYKWFDCRKCHNRNALERYHGRIEEW